MLSLAKLLAYPPPLCISAPLRRRPRPRPTRLSGRRKLETKNESPSPSKSKSSRPPEPPKSHSSRLSKRTSTSPSKSLSRAEDWESASGRVVKCAGGAIRMRPYFSLFNDDPQEELRLPRPRPTNANGQVMSIPAGFGSRRDRQAAIQAGFRPRVGGRGGGRGGGGAPGPRAKNNKKRVSILNLECYVLPQHRASYRHTSGYSLYKLIGV